VSANATGNASGTGNSVTGTTGGGSTSGTTGTPPTAGNPDGSCTSLPLPPQAQPVDTSSPTSVVGTGTPSSCTFAALSAAVSQGGIITFNCGSGPVTIPLAATLTPPTSNAYAKDPALTIVIDGGNKITLDGQGAVQIINWNHAGSWRVNDDTLTLQHIQLINGKATPTMAIPACPPSGGISNTQCSQGYDDGEGGALYMQDGNLRIIDVTFANNQAALLGPDTGGGAIYMVGTGSPSYIVQSTFTGNKASNGGAIGMLWAGAFIFNSLFDSNSAVGMGANNNDPTQCTCMNNGQNEIGSGGNGGAIYKDGGDGVALTICGSEIRNSSANEFGSAVFLTADGSNAQLILDDSLLKNNASPISYWNWCTGVSTDNPHMSGSTTCSPSPVDTTFCDTQGNCTMSCST
jgi:predicted outer membrane repeat protein